MSHEMVLTFSDAGHGWYGGELQLILWILPFLLSRGDKWCLAMGEILINQTARSSARPRPASSQWNCSPSRCLQFREQVLQAPLLLSMHLMQKLHQRIIGTLKPVRDPISCS